MKVIDNLFYTKEHDWIKVDGNKAYMGITDYAQHSLGDIVFIELPEEGTELKKGDVYATIESVKAAIDSIMPIDGTVAQANEDAADNPAKVNEDPYGSWLISFEIKDASQLSGLLSADKYKELISKEE